MYKEVECLAKKFSDTLLLVGVGQRDGVCVLCMRSGIRTAGVNKAHINTVWMKY